MADKSTVVPIGICEDVPIYIANVLIPTDLVILKMPEDDNLSIILGRPFLKHYRSCDKLHCEQSDI